MPLCRGPSRDGRQTACDLFFARDGQMGLELAGEVLLKLTSLAPRPKPTRDSHNSLRVRTDRLNKADSAG
ncbi:MAG: hypothetical protein DMF96_19600 [Acidobacteria bacterium]|nr:MAG: hypothetical protein DMF96_19600 [Acidobacteriota bacterium]